MMGAKRFPPSFSGRVKIAVQRFWGGTSSVAQTVASVRPTPKSKIPALPEKEGGALALAILLPVLLAACGEPAPDEPSAQAEADTEYAETLRTALLDAQPGDVIEIPAGRFAFDRSLSLTADGVTIRGQGMDETILTFADQVAGAEGLLVTASDFTIEDLALEDTIGDALKINEGRNIVIRGVRTEWTGGPHTQNGAYGIYPVQIDNVLIEDSVAIGASDAGIYVGQSRNAVVRRNRVELNVAGIEIENTIGADVYDNLAQDNTGGILVFNMPHLPQPGHTTRVYRNQIIENNTKNFAAEGTAVASVPAGTGVIINSNDDVEIFGNEFLNNRTASIVISSYFTSGYTEEYEEAEGFDPYPERIFIHDNTYEGGGGNPAMTELQALRIMKFGPAGNLPDVLWDGYAREDAESAQLCVPGEEATVLNLDAPNDFGDPRVEEDAHDCRIDPLPAVSEMGSP